jgi:hypothetical protein
MGSTVWKDVSRELDGFAAQGLKVRFWVRDDDACEASAPLERLHELATRYGITIGLAIIPAKVRQSLPTFMLKQGGRFHPMCHGWQHINHAPAGHKPAEFGEGRPAAAAIRDAQSALSAFRTHFSGYDAVFVPPFGRISRAVTRALPAIGFAGVSVGPGWLERKLSYLPPLAVRVPTIRMPRRSIPRLDVQIDPIDWRRGTAHSADAICRAIVRTLRPRRMGFLPSDAPVGLVTHHLAHDESIWAVCNDAMDILREHRAVEFLHVGRFFGGGRAGGSQSRGS